MFSSNTDQDKLEPATVLTSLFWRGGYRLASFADRAFQSESPYPEQRFVSPWHHRGALV